MKQKTLAANGFEKFSRTTKRAKFLAEMDRVIPWGELCEVIAPSYYKGESGRKPTDLEKMLRIYFMQQWFNLSDPGAEESIYDSSAIRAFVGIDLGVEPAPDETTICKFRHLLERNDLGLPLFEQVQAFLRRQGLKVTTGTIVDATIIHAPSSTKNQQQQRDPEMHQTRKGKQWYHGMKAHIGVDSRTQLIHSMVATAANVADSTVMAELLHGDETEVWGDQAYQGQEALIAIHAPNAQDLTNKRCRYKGVVNEAERDRNRIKSKVRSRVEHVFGIIKLRFGFIKVRYRGLAKNLHRLQVTCALANLYTAKNHLLSLQQA